MSFFTFMSKIYIIIKKHQHIFTTKSIQQKCLIMIIIIIIIFNYEWKVLTDRLFFHWSVCIKITHRQHKSVIGNFLITVSQISFGYLINNLKCIKKNGEHCKRKLMTWFFTLIRRYTVYVRTADETKNARYNLQFVRRRRCFKVKQHENTATTHIKN